MLHGKDSTVRRPASDPDRDRSFLPRRRHLLMATVPAGFQAGYIAVEVASAGEDLIFWVLDQTQMDEVEVLYKANNDYCASMEEVIEGHDLGLNGQRHRSIVEAMAYMTKNNFFLVEDFSYISY